MIATVSDVLRKIPGLRFWRRVLRYSPAYLSFIGRKQPRLTFLKRVRLVARLAVINSRVACAHSEQEALDVIRAILSLSDQQDGVVVEAGVYKGGSAAKFSIAAALTGRRLILFDSFAGIPDHEEPHSTNIYGGPAKFPAGSYAGSLDEVKHNIRRYGELQVCEFKQGWFDDTMPQFQQDVAVAYIDVDLVSSTRACVKYLYPRLIPGGVIFSQDGHLPLVIEALQDDQFWLEEVGCPRPEITGLGTERFVCITKARCGQEHSLT